MTRDELLQATQSLEDAMRRFKASMVIRETPVFAEAQALGRACYDLECLAARIERHAQAEKQRWFILRENERDSSH